MTEIIGALRGVTKAYPGTLAAQDVTIEFHRGEIHGVVGENGAGKSTLVKILAGLIEPDRGHVEMRNQVCDFASPRDSLLAGIGVVHQAGSLIETLTVEENLQLGQPGDLRKNRLPPPDLPLHVRVNRLTMRQRQLVEIYRLMLQDAQLLVLDEPTASLTRQEASLLFRDLEALADEGRSIVVISHKLPELISHCHTFTVLRKGKLVARVNSEDASVSKLVHLCSGQQTTDAATPVSHSEPSADLDLPPLVHLRKVTTSGDDCDPLEDVDLVLRRGEILGLAGRSGSGVTTLLELLRNERSTIRSGTMEWDPRGQNGFENHAVGYVPADRNAYGVILDFTIGENLKLRRRNLLSRLGKPRREERGFVESLIARFDIRPPRGDEKLRNLSGGNAQKVLLAREMDHSQLLLIVESPTAGLDIGSANFVRTLLQQKADEGACVVIYSNDLDELAEVSDRVVIFAEGRVTAELRDREISSDLIGLALFKTTPAASDLQTAGPETPICVD